MTDPMPAVRDILGMKAPILPADIRKGDRIRCEYDESKVEYHSTATEYTAPENGYKYSHRPTTHYLLKRPVPPVVLPTAIGYHADKEGSVWYRQSTGANNGHHWQDSDGERHNDEVARRFAPFKRLRDEAEVAAEVLAEVGKAMNLRMVPEQGTGRVVLSLRNFRDDLMKMSDKWATK